MKDMFKVFDVVTLTTDSLEEASGLKKGDEFVIASIQPLPVSKEDPYTQRLYMFLNKFEGDELLLPNENNYTYPVDPDNLKKVSKARSNRILQLVENQFKESTQLN